LQKGLQLRINAQGLIHGKRQRYDGCVLFGSQDYGPQGEVLNDFIIPADDSGIGSRHLMIKYDPAERDYFIKDLGDGSGTFVKVEINLVSLNNYRNLKLATSFPLGTLTCWFRFRMKEKREKAKYF